MPGVTYEPVRPVHPARPGRDPRRHRAAADRALRPAPGALERVDPGRREGHRDAEAALGHRDDGRRQRRLLRSRHRPPERRPDARRRRRQPAVRRPLEHRDLARRHARHPAGRVLRHLARPRPAATLTDLNQAPGTNGDLALHAQLRPRDAGSGRRRPRWSSQPFPPATPNTDLSGTVVEFSGVGGTPIPPGRRRARRPRHGRAAARWRRLRSDRRVTVRLILRPDWTGVAQRGRRRARDRPGRRPGLPRERGLLVLPARAAPPAHRSRPARGRADPDGRRRRPAAGLQRRHDELRARAGARPAGRGDRAPPSTAAAPRRSPSTGRC